MSKIGIVFRKEVMDNLRDRRALTSMLMGTLIGPGLMMLLFFVIGRTVSEQSEQVIHLPVIGAEHAPGLMAFLEAGGIEIEAAPDNPEEAVRLGDVELVVIIPEGFEDAIAAETPAQIELIVDRTSQGSGIVVDRTRGLIRAYADSIILTRLEARDIDPLLLQPLVTETTDVSTPESQGAQMLSMMPYFIVFSVFLGGMHLAIDSTAGERERNSLEALLSLPVRRQVFVLGKMGATMLFTLVAVSGTLIAFMVLLNTVPLDDLVGAEVRLNPLTVLGLFLVTLPMVPLATALQTIIAAFSRTYKEAQSYLSFLPLIPALPGMLLAFVPVNAKIWMMLIPTFGQQLLINQVMRQEPMNPVFVATSVLTTLIFSALLAWIAYRLYSREQILFGRK
jgi:sodium transport system permease protein